MIAMILRYSCCLTCLALFARTPAVAQDTARGMTYGVETAFRSGHADRGFIISDRAVIQPVTWVAWHSAEFSAWTSLPLTANTDGSRPQIVELELVREYELGRFTIGPGARMYFYHDALSRTRDRSLEGWLYLSYDLGPFSLFTNHSLDIKTYKGAYFVDAGVASQRRVSQWLEIGGLLGAGFGSARFNDAYARVPIPALDRLTAQGSLTAHLNHFYIGPQVEYSSIVDRAVRTGAFRPTYLLLQLTLGGEF